MFAQWVIEKKRDGGALTSDEIGAFITGYTVGDIPDYQMSALAMAIYFQGMSFDEVTALTNAMLHSGDLVDTSSLTRPKADKHSTGGIGDKLSLLLAPLAACSGIDVPMISGRGLGITGGTLDKLESIPGYRCDLSEAEFLAVLHECGCSITGQTASLVPADKKLYALRDVTATVPSIPLIAASIMSKKLAEGTDVLVLDVKCGRGAFMKNVDDARALARMMVEIGHRMGKGMSALITDMNAPIGRTVGNALEIRETLAGLSGQGADDMMSLTYALTAEMLVLSNCETDRAAAKKKLLHDVTSGAALARFRQMVALHGGVGDIETQLPVARIQETITAPTSGTVSAVDADKIGRAGIVLGAGRARVEDGIDHAVGIADLVAIGERCQAGDVLATIHANSKETCDEALLYVKDAYIISSKTIPPRSLIIETVQPGE
ncbi:MAG: pyrimidine-nucleoside phosphorylase [Candidatus Promineifilaceae bacterium]|jgi:pyrimidine-nucleoside phosphorylase